MRKISNNEWRIGQLTLPGRVLAAPMAGITDRVYRRILREQGASFCYTEMVCAKALLFQNSKTYAIMNIEGEEDTCGIQLFGANPEEMAQAAKLSCNAGAQLIDINMGCPMAKIVADGSGAAMLRQPELAMRVAESVVQAAGSVPVTVKLRRGYAIGDDSGVALACRLPEVGVAALTIHGRYREQYYEGRADWDCIRRVKESVRVPVIGNGDVFSANDGLRMMAETGCDGVMVARGMLGNPWLMGALDDALAKRPPRAAVSLQERVDMAVRQLDENCVLYGEYMGVRLMRKFMGWYLKGYPHSAVVRDRLFRAHERDVMVQLLHDFAAWNSGE